MEQTYDKYGQSPREPLYRPSAVCAVLSPLHTSRRVCLVPIKTKDRRRKTEDQDSRPDPPYTAMSVRQVRTLPLSTRYPRKQHRYHHKPCSNHVPKPLLLPTPTRKQQRDHQTVLRRQCKTTLFDQTSSKTTRRSSQTVLRRQC